MSLARMVAKSPKDPKFRRKLEVLRQGFSALVGSPFRYFYCPILFTDEDVSLCRGHIVNRGFANSSRRWTVQREDVDNFFGWFAESDFVDLQDACPGLAARALIDPQLRRRFRPRIVLNGEPVDYFLAKTELPSSFTSVLFQREGVTERLGLKVPPSIFASSAGTLQIEVVKDMVLPAVVSVIKSAHLTLFEMFGYQYALTESGAFVASVLGSFFVQNVGQSKSEVLKNAASHFQPVTPMVRPFAASPVGLAGTIGDGRIGLCWLEGAYPPRPWAMIVFVRTNRSVHAALIAMLDNATCKERFVRFLERGEDTLLVSLDQFKNGKWLNIIPPMEFLWPAGGRAGG